MQSYQKKWLRRKEKIVWGLRRLTAEGRAEAMWDAGAPGRQQQEMQGAMGCSVPDTASSRGSNTPTAGHGRAHGWGGSALGAAGGRTAKARHRQRGVRGKVWEPALPAPRWGKAEGRKYCSPLSRDSPTSCREDHAGEGFPDRRCRPWRIHMGAGIFPERLQPTEDSKLEGEGATEGSYYGLVPAHAWCPSTMWLDKAEELGMED